jgi:hypothetical protein
MKKLAFLLILSGMIIAGCKTQQKATTENIDDVYYSKPKVTQAPAKDAGSAQDLSAPKYVTPPDSSSSVKAGSATTVPDNSDYSYSARLKHFHDPATGLPYSDNYYSGSPSDSSGGNTTVNVYSGGGGWDPSFSMSFGMGWGYGGYPYGGWGYGWDYGWGYPYYGWGYPYYGYGYPYYYGGCGCCGYGYYPYYDYGYGNGTYYGRRTSVYSNDGSGNSNQRTSAQNTVTDQARNNTVTPTGQSARGTITPPTPGNTGATRSIASGTTPGTNVTPATRTVNPTPKPAVTRAPADQQHYTYQRSTAQKTQVSPRTTPKNTQSQVQRANPRYVKPENSTPSRTGQAQIYSSPAYRQPKSSQEYINPRNQEAQKSGNNTSRAYSSPSNNVRRSGTGTTHSYSTPSGTNRSSYSAPARSYSPGSSSPARTSGGSYSAPARSSGGSGGGNSGGGGGTRSGGGGGGGGSHGGGSGGGRR